MEEDDGSSVFPDGFNDLDGRYSRWRWHIDNDRFGLFYPEDRLRRR
jgi:hypothetical protein